ncbi:DNA excision repair protein ERCC-6 [Frankliniella fusca]|uniref:DNA repair and recombination protein RAD54-like n=1 Tax=Frankliniella fusca TaxID=407009 RepID=A0AAE1L7S0_9NEOP|nr:DNA excision repair protein ERCC-6 [Frankliniella fusca]
MDFVAGNSSAALENTVNQNNSSPASSPLSSELVEDDANTQNNSQIISDPESSVVSTRFEIDVNQIQNVTVDDQDADIQSLGLTVYNQSTLEQGIWDQVERETRKREAQEELANVSTKLKLAEEQLKRVESAKGIKRSILQSALEEPSQKKSNKTVLEKHKDITNEKVKELQLKKAKLQAKLNNKDSIEKDQSAEESERDRKIRMGEMTPFGSTLSGPSSDLSSFEKYLKNQQDLHKKMMSNILAKKKQTPKPKFTRKDTIEKPERPLAKEKTDNHRKSSKEILKKSILFPRKRELKENLGTNISFPEIDQYVSPAAQPGENAVVDLEDSGSEYLPSESDEDFAIESRKKRESSSDQKKTPGSSRRKTVLDKWSGGSLKSKRRRRNVQVVSEGDPEDWCSDDSDWICTDDEEFSSDNESNRKKSKGSKRGKDDGNNDDFHRRIKLWEHQNEGLREQMEEDVHEFENGFRLPNIIWDKLYMYQQVGVRWMWELNQQRVGGILGDEMGLGKTIQIISFLAGLSISKLKCRTTGYRGLGPTLIVCPTTVMHQWVREFHTWFPPLRVAILHESGSFMGKRSQLVRDMMHERGILVTSYTAIVRLKDHLLHQRWHYVILDEGHKIRNPDAQVTLAVKQLRTPHRLILSGSPLQNHLRELWSLMDFVFPGKLGTLPVFMSEFAVPINQGGYSNASEVMVATAYKCATVLRDTISPYLLRRMKADVSEHIKLPSKNEQVLFCRLTDEQRDLYKGYLECGEVGRILEGRCQIFVGLINLRKICNHPHLYSGGPKLFSHEKEEDLRLEDRFGYWEKAGKMVVIEALLKMWHKQEHRVLIFTQSRQMLLIMEKFDKSYFVMLLTTKVGGLGVNLTGANRVVIYDPDWNPATDTQARERAWRIGQQNSVTVYRLITAGTIEEKMYHRQIFKQFLCNKVLKDPRQRRFFKSNDLLELFTLKETDDGTTETSAIFAGTNSQVNVKPKQDSHKTVKDKKNSPHSFKGRSKSEDVASKARSKQSNEEKDSKISFSQDKLDHMKKLAHELSLKLANKASIASKPEDADTKETDSIPKFKKDEILTSSESAVVESGPCSVEDSNSVVGNETREHLKDRTDSTVTQQSTIHVLEEKETSEASVILQRQEDTLVCDSDDDLEEMKQIAQELTKELSHKVQAAAALNKGIPGKIAVSTTPSKCGISDEISQNKNSSVKPDLLEPIDHEFQSTVHIVGNKNDHSASALKDSSINQRSSFFTGNSKRKETPELRKEQLLPSRHKKSRKHKKHKHKDAVFEGERVRGLVRSSTLEEKTKDELAEEASHSKKQDDYVLRKLFSKTGIKTAMQHEKIMESGHADYALVEGEARKVAQEAIKNMRASRQNCWSAMSGQPTWTGASGSIRTSEEADNRSQTSRPKFGKKKPMAKSRSSQSSSRKEAEEEGGSSSLLARIRARNLLLTDDEEGTTSTPAPVPDSNRELLDEIRTFVSFGASVDGRATTDEIVSKFQDRLPTQSTALFKQMLMQICEFHRLPSGQGVWKLIQEFNW